VKLAKIMLVSSMLLVPTMAMGIAQQEQDPATGQQLQQDPATDPATGQQLDQEQQSPAGQQNLNQESQQAMSGEPMHGTIVEIRDDSFSVRTEDKGVVWFMLTPELKTQYSAELVTGNHIQVWSSPGDSPDRMNATRIERYEGDAMAETETTTDATTTESAVAEADADLDVDVDAETDPAAAEFETDTELESAQVAEAETESAFQEETTEFDTETERSELPRPASSLPALGAVGLLALLGAAVVAIARRF
jgi:hypothetical protein